MPVTKGDFERGNGGVRPYCHGNRLSLRLLEEDHFILILRKFGYYGPQGGVKPLSLQNLNPDSSRRYKPGMPRKHREENFAEPPPWPHLRVCDKCGFVFGGGFRFHPKNKKVQQWLRETGTFVIVEEESDGRYN